MNLKTTLLVFAFSCWGMVSVVSQNNLLNIVQADNSNKTVDLDLLRKITFSAGNLVLNYRAGNTETSDISQIRKLVFGTSTGLWDSYASQDSFHVYPNPTREYIQLNEIPGNLSGIAIYTTGGLKVMDVPPTSNKIDVSPLAPGIYLVKVNNHVLKFSKL
ncbi:MAG TPA: T9SS type A sorting domain-containing protein [Paludibacter sp.]|nr:T9SS type A sorting domain-containing protein [Paludibacter sp.]